MNPSQPPQALSDEQIDELASEHNIYADAGDIVLCNVSDVREFARALLATRAPAPAAEPALREAPEGWKLVPIKYTSEQMDAALARAQQFTSSKNSNAVKARAFDFCTGYRVMVEAAPTPLPPPDSSLADPAVPSLGPSGSGASSGLA